MPYLNHDKARKVVNRRGRDSRTEEPEAPRPGSFGRVW